VYALLMSFEIIAGAKAFASSLASFLITKKHFLVFNLVLPGKHISALFDSH
jgi:hypothetical protein